MNKNEINRDYTQFEIENNLNLRILKITQLIHSAHPELSKYLEEMPVTIPDEKKPELNIKSLQNYYESLNSLLTKYELEHPKK